MNITMPKKFNIAKTFLVSADQALWIQQQPKSFNFSEAMRSKLDELIGDHTAVQAWNARRTDGIDHAKYLSSGRPA